MKILSNFFLFLLLNGFTLLYGFSQNSGTDKPKLYFQTLLEGLNNERVTSVNQDQYGFIWIGTYNGLHRYDGVKFRIYSNTKDSTSIPNSRIEKIFSDSQGNLWVGTANGLCRYNWRQDNFSRFPLVSGLVKAGDPAPDKITAITEDAKGTIWVGSSKEGLLSFDQEKQSFVPFFSDSKSYALSSMFVTEVCVGKNDDLWIGLNNGLNKLNTKTAKVTHFQNENGEGLEGKQIRGLAIEANGDVWAGTWENGLFLLKEKDQERKKFIRFQHNPDDIYSLGNNSIYTIFIDRQNRLWVGNENGGLHLYDRKKKLFYRNVPDETNPYSITTHSVWSIFEDQENRLWIGTANSGVNILDQYFLKFTHYFHSPLNPNGLNNNIVSGFWEEKNGNVWIATDGGGLNHWNRRKGIFTHYMHDAKDPYSIGSNALLDFSEDTEGRLWVGTWDGNINVLTDREKMRFMKLQDLQKEDSLAASIKHTFALYRDRKGNMWSGNFESGLAIHNLKKKNTKIFFNDPADNQSLSNNTINSVLEDSDGNIWAGAAFNGLNKISLSESGKLISKRFLPGDSDSTGIIGDLINQVYEDSKKNIWVATDKGLSKISAADKKITSYTSADGLPSDIIESITEDKNGLLWLGTAKGLAGFDPVQNTIKVYSVSDGLQGNKFTRHAVGKLKNGEILFGGSNGFNIFHPDSVKANPNKPRVYITDLKLFNKSVKIGENDSLLKAPVALTKEITLKHHQNIISFDFVALNYTHSGKNQYAFMMDGLENDWNYVGNQQNTTYTNLDPGHYTFRVKASNNDGVWNQEGTALSIIITPPYWQTWWFRTILGLSLIGGAFTFYMVRMNAVKAQKAELEKQVKEQTADIRKANEDLVERQEEILMQQEELQAQSEVLQETNANLQQTQEEIAVQRDHLKIVNEQVMSSIQYARTIQKAILPADQDITEVFPEHFIIYRPKDVVSGDFYWFSHLSKEESGLATDLTFMAVVDCTGHGVPGAFMSIIGSTLLNEIVNQKQITDPAQILEQLHMGVKKAVEKSEGVNTAGMDVCLCRFENLPGQQEVKVLFSGAKRNLLYVKPGTTKAEKLLADRRSIGSEASIPFTTQELMLSRGSMLYMLSDGFADQNNAAREKIGTRKVHELICQYSGLPVMEQKELLEAALDNHQQDAEQRDDITLTGIRL